MFPSSNIQRKGAKSTWRCFENNGSLRPGLTFDHKSHTSHVYADHRNRARAFLNGCISLILHQKLYMRRFFFPNLRCLSVWVYSKPVYEMNSRSWRCHPISEYWPNICCSQRQTDKKQVHDIPENVLKTMEFWRQDQCSATSHTCHMCMLATKSKVLQTRPSDEA